jgi:SAM-dependent methyltransferase
MLRAYLEQRAVRELLMSVCPPRANANAAACDVGCGFGRLTPVLGEFAPHVVGFEREPGLLATARRLQPDVEFRAVDQLASLPGESAAFDIVLVFTVLQHIPEPALLDVIAEVRRILKPSGVLLLCEETDAALEAGDPARADLGYTRGRSVESYAGWFAPWRVVATRPRIIEPDYPRPDVGTYMLFRKEEG